MMVNRWEDQDEVPGAETIPGGGHSLPADDHSSLLAAQKRENLPFPVLPPVRGGGREEEAVRVC